MGVKDDLNTIDAIAVFISGIALITGIDSDSVFRVQKILISPFT